MRMLRQSVCADVAPQQKVQCVQLLSSVLLVYAHGFIGDLGGLSQSSELFFDSGAVHLHFVLLHQGTILVSSTIV